MAEAGLTFPAEAAAVLVETALREDLGTAQPEPDADLTAATVVPAGLQAEAVVIARAAGVVAGLPAAGLVFARLDRRVEFHPRVKDGDHVEVGGLVAEIRGPARALLAGERTALNLLQHLSGVATLTRAFVEAVAGTSARITDTRKTTPGMRLLEKWAVRAGGGVNHRLGLHDAVLIKENHAASVGGVAAAVTLAREALVRRGSTGIPVYAEARDLDEVRALLAHPPDRVMLDNMSPVQLVEAVTLIRAAGIPVAIEATGGVTLSTVRSIAATGVDLISIGGLTHSAPALDLSMLFEAAAAG